MDRDLAQIRIIACFQQKISWTPRKTHCGASEGWTVVRWGVQRCAADGGAVTSVLGPGRADEMNVAELAGAAAGGDRAALKTLIETHYDRIYRMAWRWSGSVQMAEDVAQDVCIKVATSISGFRGQAKFTTWLWQIVYRTALDHQRISGRQQLHPPDTLQTLVDARQWQTHDGDAESDYDDLWSAVRALPPQQRDAVLLVYAETLSHAEAADVLGCTAKTVSWHLHEARKTLRAQLEAAE